MQIRFGPIRNVEKLQAYLRTLPRGTIRTAIRAFTEYIVGDSSHGLAHDDPYHYVSRKAAYGQTFQSDKQRRYVMAMIKSGEITPGVRKNSPTNQSQVYGIQETNGGYGATITNSSEGAYWTRKAQPAQLRMAGWRAYADVVAANVQGALRHAGAAVRSFLQKKG